MVSMVHSPVGSQTFVAYVPVQSQILQPAGRSPNSSREFKASTSPYSSQPTSPQTQNLSPQSRVPMTAQMVAPSSPTVTSGVVMNSAPIFSPTSRPIVTNALPAVTKS